jgi:nitroimidazol reductase NimA-like FMN-containing flavoprotein (pyridoxamine 5'-phosphate oxidase superfamily)
VYATAADPVHDWDLAAAKDPGELSAIAKSVIDSNQFMTLATADDHGQPWPSPVWYAPSAYRTFFWVSSPDARHSRNLRGRPQVGIVIFDSHRTGGWNAVYMSAEAEEVADAEVDEGLRIFSKRSEELGFGPWPRDRVVAPARHRLYRAVAIQQFVLDTHDERVPIDPT